MAYLIQGLAETKVLLRGYPRKTDLIRWLLVVFLTESFFLLGIGQVLNPTPWILNCDTYSLLTLLFLYTTLLLAIF